MRNAIGLGFALLIVSPLGADDQAKFLKLHCCRCHGAELQESDRRFDDLPVDIVTPNDLQRYQEIVDQLNLRSMPPEDEPQPTDAARVAMIEALTGKLAAARARLGGNRGHTQLRRLNAWEYRHTIGDLLSLNIDAWNPSEDFPAEVSVDGFDNNGASLVTSGMLLDQYLEAAEEAVHRATQFGERPVTRRYRQESPFYFAGKDYADLPKLFQIDRFRFTPETPYTDLYGRHYRGGHIGFLPLARGGLPASGEYTIRVLAAAVDRTHDYGDALGDFRNGDPLVLELASVDRRGSVESTGSVSHMISLKRVELTSDQPQWIEWTGFLEAGYEPEVRFRNGPLAAKRMVRLLTTKAADHPEFKPFVDLKAGMEKAHGVLKAYRGPKLRVWEIQVEGPHAEQWPPRGHQRLYGKLQIDELDRERISSRLRAFATDAFRRPPRPAELDPIIEFVTAKLDEGVENLEALQLGFQAILCSPGFLYLDEPEGPLDSHAIASRLSYFLWSSLPDQRLLNLASKDRLRDAATIGNEVDRMLADRRSDRFVQHFIHRWLDLDNIGKMPPTSDFLEYYRDNLAEAMRNETESMFRHVLDQNLPPSELLTAEYSFLNRELAAHYGIDGVSGSELQQVSLTGTPRGGMLGQALFLTASANGVDTSPVVRGIYVLEKLLGYSPPPPPPDVPVIEPDISGAKTIRQQLVKHRQEAACAKCHRKIDPMGFGLENFDAIGGWRDHYEGKLPIDSSGVFPGGEDFGTIEEFREQIIARKGEFDRCLTEKLLTYAIGRRLDISDRPDVDAIVSELQGESAGLTDLIKLVVASEAFRHN